MKNTTVTLLLTLLFGVSALLSQAQTSTPPMEISGIYPSLAYVNDEGECGTGAVVPWADRLWVITYGPHMPFGSTDKLYEITPDMQLIKREESIGGTHANRFIHRPTNQLFIGPYAIDAQRNVRAITSDRMPGRLTGACQSLSDSTRKVMMATMEQGFYEVDAKTLDVKTISPDGNQLHKDGAPAIYGTLCKGVHGKGFYSGQGVYVYTNNGESSDEALRNPNIESGSLSEYDGVEWKLVRRNQFTEATGPSGIYAPNNPDNDPIWAMGWDNKSVILAVRDKQRGWDFFRLPKASHSYDGAHGWNTEWPRIRDVGEWDGDYLLMTMHGMFWKFPKSFTATAASGIRPLSAYLKVIGDFAKWNGKLVFGCDDTAKNEFLNRRSQKGDLPSPAQSCSNLWFSSLKEISHLGPITADGAVWLNDEVEAGKASEPMLVAGWKHYQAWIQNSGNTTVNFIFETDKKGTGTWTPFTTVSVGAGTSMAVELKNPKAEWIRVTADKKTTASVIFTFSPSHSQTISEGKAEAKQKNTFKGLATSTERSSIGGKLYSLGNDSRKLAVFVNNTIGTTTTEKGFYTLNTSLKLTPSPLPPATEVSYEKLSAKTSGAVLDSLSILITDDQGRRWRLPIADDMLAKLSSEGKTRICREVVTERDLFHFGGTFFELPAENAGGFARIRPIASHHYRIDDYASYCGMLVMTGINITTTDNPHIIRSHDGHAAVWAGVIDDLWKLGKPAGHASLWRNTKVSAGEISDPVLVGFYEQKSITLINSSKENATVIIEADPDGSGTWMTYQTITVNAGKRIKHVFDNGFQARWIRLRSVTDAILTANIECTFRQTKDEEPLPENPSLIGRGVMIATSGESNNNLPGGGR